MADNSGSGAILGVLVGALIVIGVLFFAFGGADVFTGGGDGDLDVTIEAPAEPSNS